MVLRWISCNAQKYIKEFIHVMTFWFFIEMLQYSKSFILFLKWKNGENASLWVTHSGSYHLRQGCRMEFLDHFFNFWDFSRPKSYHSNLPIAFIVDHLKPNGFQYHIDQARNCPFGLPDGRWHHVRLRHRLLRNRKKCKSFKQFSEKRMKLELIKIALH